MQTIAMALRDAAASVKRLIDDACAVLTDHPLRNHPVLGRGRYLRRLSHKGRHRPVMLICETVNICNNDCIICPYSVHSRSKGTMTMQIVTARENSRSWSGHFEKYTSRSTA